MKEVIIGELSHSFSELFSCFCIERPAVTGHQDKEWKLKNRRSQRGILRKLGTRDGLITRPVPPRGGTLRVIAGSLA